MRSSVVPPAEEHKRASADTRRRNRALRAEADAHRHDAKLREWHEKVMFLSRDQATAGEPCRGCGLPVIDGLGSFPPLMRLSPEERVEYEAAEARYKQMHPNCRSHRWSVQGSRSTHCGYCCPPIPVSRSQLDAVASIFEGYLRRDEEVDIWALDLTCGHRTERSIHHTQRFWVKPTTHCLACDMTRGVVTSERIIDAAAGIAEAKRTKDAGIAEAEQDVRNAENAAREARERLASLKGGQYR